MAIWDRVLDAAEITRLFQEGGRAEGPRDVAAVERKRPRQDGAPSVEELLKRNRLVPSFAQRLSREILASAGQKTLPLHRLTVEFPESVDQVRSRVDLDSPELVKRLAAKDGPLVPGPDARAFYPPGEREQLSDLQTQSRKLAATVFPRLASAMVAFDDKKPADLRIHVAGDNRR
ncbi:MAG TPA: hypothetical protein DCE43_17355, partial [Planctomycetaceae bacterium]|nr:hypothetical protein [Planctomycetaceae bacterium]